MITPFTLSPSPFLFFKVCRTVSFQNFVKFYFDFFVLFYATALFLQVYENVVESFGCVLLPKPDCCPQHIYDLMKECWQAKLNRPRIDKLRRSLVLWVLHFYFSFLKERERASERERE